jgi:hypothetical protein
VHYGKHNSVFQKLTAMNLSILKSNCNCHVIHNAARNGRKALTFDIENLILKVFSEFSNSAKKSQHLKKCFEFLEMEYEDVLRLVVTRWLSLSRCLEHVLSSWPPIKLYFIQQGEEQINKVIWSFVQHQEGELQGDTKVRLSSPEYYLYFVHYFMSIMTLSVLMSERNTVMSSEIQDIMYILKDKLESRLRDNFFGIKVNSSLKYLDSVNKENH